MMVGWFSTVINESEQGMYDDQVDTSFRIGMIWFIFRSYVFSIFSGHYSMLGHIPYLWVRWRGSGLVTTPSYGLNTRMYGPLLQMVQLR